MSKLQEKPSALKREHPALRKMKFLNLIFFVGHFCPPGSGSGSTDLIESGYRSLTLLTEQIHSKRKIETLVPVLTNYPAGFFNLWIIWYCFLTIPRGERLSRILIYWSGTSILIEELIVNKNSIRRMILIRVTFNFQQWSFFILL